MVDELPNLRAEETAELTGLLDRGKLLEVAEYSKLKDRFQFTHGAGAAGCGALIARFRTRTAS